MQVPDVCGGAQPHVSPGTLPAELLRELPKFFFSCKYLRSLALCSKSFCRAAADARHWAGKHLCVDFPEYDAAELLQQAARLSRLAKTLTVDAAQLPHLGDCLPGLAAQLFIRWDGWLVVTPRAAADRVYAWESQILLGDSWFRLVLPMFTQTLYIGVQAPASNRRAFCKLSFPFTGDMSIEIGLSDELPLSPVNPLPAQLRQGLAHDVQLNWDSRHLAVTIDGVGVTRATLNPWVADAPPAQAIATPWSPIRSPLHVFPMPSPLRRDIIVTCGVCGRRGGLSGPRWAVCTLCHNWACAEHVRRTPLRRCPSCVLQFSDYRGGKTLDCCARDLYIQLFHVVFAEQDVETRLEQPLPVRGTVPWGDAVLGDVDHYDRGAGSPASESDADSGFELYLFATGDDEDSDPELDICVVEDEHGFEFIHRRFPSCTTATEVSPQGCCVGALQRVGL